MLGLGVRCHEAAMLFIMYCPTALSSIQVVMTAQETGLEILSPDDSSFSLKHPGLTGRADTLLCPSSDQREIDRLCSFDSGFSYVL